MVILGHLARNDPGFPGKVPVSTCNLVENFFKKSIFLSGKVTGSPSTSPRKKKKNLLTQKNISFQRKSSDKMTNFLAEILKISSNFYLENSLKISAFNFLSSYFYLEISVQTFFNFSKQKFKKSMLNYFFPAILQSQSKLYKITFI